jgi:hypothetical protein
MVTIIHMLEAIFPEPTLLCRANGDNKILLLLIIN